MHVLKKTDFNVYLDPLTTVSKKKCEAHLLNAFTVPFCFKTVISIVLSVFITAVSLAHRLLV